MESEMERAVKDFTLRLQSNGGYYTPSSPNRHPEFLDSENVLRTVAPFTIFYHNVSDTRVHLYCRGHIITADYHPNLITWVDAIEQRQAV